MAKSRTLAVIASAVMVACASMARAQANRTPPLLTTTRLAPDEYGLNDYTVTTISSVSFMPISDDTSSSPNYNTYSDFFRFGLDNNTHFAATVSIPSGAVIDYIGLESWSFGGPDAAEVQLYLVDRYDNITPIAGFQSTQHSYDSDYNSSAIGFQLARNVHNQLVVDVETHILGDLYGEFGWVEIWWKRAVSPAPATPTFNDVPTTDTGFQYIEALAASGITGGCGGGDFCPSATLTRRQMAVFLAKALGLHWPY